LADVALEARLRPDDTAPARLSDPTLVIRASRSRPTATTGSAG